MRAQTKMEKEMAFALASSLAIYRGLPDSERAERLELARQHRRSTDVQLRTFAANILPLLEQAEAEIQTERRRTKEIERRLAYLEQARTIPSPSVDMYNSVRAEQSRALFGITLVAAGVAGVYWACVTVGPAVVFGSLAAIFLLSKIFAGGGESESDYTPTAGQAQAGQSININITGHGGQINFSQGQA